MANLHEATSAAKRGYPTAAQIVRLIRTLRGEGINPSSLKFDADGSIQISAIPQAGEVLSDFDVWNQAGKL